MWQKASQYHWNCLFSCHMLLVGVKMGKNIFPNIWKNHTFCSIFDLIMFYFVLILVFYLIEQGAVPLLIIFILWQCDQKFWKDSNILVDVLVEGWTCPPGNSRVSDRLQRRRKSISVLYDVSRRRHCVCVVLCEVIVQEAHGHEESVLAVLSFAPRPLVLKLKWEMITSPRLQDWFWFKIRVSALILICTFGVEYFTYNFVINM